MKRLELSPIRSILCIRMGRLGDIILLLPAIAALKLRMPDAQIRLLTDHRFAPMAELCPDIDAVIPVNRLLMRDGGKAGAIQAMTHLVRRVRKHRFDLVIDFHGFTETQLLAGMSGGRHRIGMHRVQRTYLPLCFSLPAVPEDKSIHVADMFMKIVDAVAAGAKPRDQKLLAAPADIASRVLERLPATPRIGFYVGARAADHIWPAERFSQLADRITGELGASVVVIGGASPREAALPAEVRAGCKHMEKVCTIAQPGIAELVAAITSLDILVSNDSGPMHIGPAVGVPTLGLFGLSDPLHYRPTGANDRFLRAENVQDISVDAVLDTLRNMQAL